MKKISFFILFAIGIVFSTNVNLLANENRRIDNYVTANREFMCNEDGTCTDRFYSNTINYYEDGSYKKIDNSFKKTETGFVTNESNYKLFVPSKLDTNTNIKIGYYDYNLFFKFKNIIDEMNGVICKKNGSSEFVYSEKMVYSNNEFIISLDNYTDNLRLIINAKTIKNLNDLVINVYSDNLKFYKNESVTKIVDPNNITIYEINMNYTIKIGDEVYNRKLDVDNEGVLHLEKESLLRNNGATIEIPISYSINNNSNYIIDKYVTNGLDYSYDTEYMKVGTDNTNEYRTIVLINMSSLSPNVDIYSANLVYYKESGTNNRLDLFQIDDELYSDITGVTNYTKKAVDSTTFSNVYNFDLTHILSSGLSSGNNMFVFEISIASGLSGVSWLASEDSYEMPYLEISYENNYCSDYGAATSYNHISSGNMNCFGYALNINEFLQLVDDGNNNVEPPQILTENIFHSLYIPVALSTIERKGYSARIISDYDSPIYDNEYRIAFRIGRITNINYSKDFHFLKQNNDGTWSHKRGRAVSENLLYVTNPSNYSWDLVVNEQTGEKDIGFYNSSICYIAIGV